MWKYWGTKDNVFWDAGTIDKPSREYINNMNWEQLDINLNLIENSLIQIMLNKANYGLIRAQNDETGVNVYFMLKRVLKHVQNGFLLEYEKDTWTTHTLPLTEQDINVLVDRHQDYNDDKCLNFNEDTNIDINYNNFEINKTYFKTTTKTNDYRYIYSDDAIIRVSNQSRLNPLYCLVLNHELDLSSSGRTLIPILSDSGLCKFHTKVQFGALKTFQIAQGVDIKNRVNIDVGINQWFDALDKNKKWIYKIIININNENYCIFSENLKNVNYIQFNRFIDGGVELRTNEGLYLLTPFNSKDNTIATSIYAEAEEQSISYKFDVLNSYNKIIELSKTDLANKIEGLYLIPNILNLSDLWLYGFLKNNNANGLMVLNTDISGNAIKKPLKIFKDLKIDNNLIFNNENIQFKYLLKYFDVNYLNNNIDISKYWKDENVEINYSLLFTNSFNLLTNNQKFPLENRLIELPNKQSFPINTYAEYVQANMNTVNTGYAIQKQQSITNGVSGVFSGLMGGVITGALGGNLMGGISGAGSAISSISSTVVGMKNYEKQIKAKYADAQNTMGSKVLFGATRDVLWNTHINEEQKKAYDLCMYRKLTTDSIKQLNNYFLLNGVYNPKYFKLNNLPQSTKHLGFVYAKLNSTNFNQIFSKYINTSRVTKDIILHELEEFRMWDKIPSIE